MKNLLILLLPFIFLACSKDLPEIDSKPYFESYFNYNFKKEISVFDKERTNKITLLISSDNEELLSNYNDNSFTLSFVKPNTLVENDEIEESSTIEINTALPKIGIEIMKKDFNAESKTFFLISQAADFEDSEETLRAGCKLSFAEEIYDVGARCVKTRNNSSKLCNDFRVVVIAPPLNDQTLSDYISKKKHGMTWTCYPPTANASGLLVTIYKGKRADYDIEFTY